MKLHQIAAVVALAAAGSAHALVQTSLGNAEVFFAAYDDAATKSFIFDTGINVSQLSNGTINFNLNLDTDANWTSFVSSVGGLSNVNWMVQAIQNKTGVNTKFIYSTMPIGTTTGMLTQGSNTAFNGSINNEINALAAVQVGAGQSEVDAAGTAAYYGDNYDKFAAVGLAQLSNKVNAGNVSFWGAANSNTSSGVAKITWLNTTTLATVAANVSTASGSTVLSIAAAPVPEPTTNALALAALAGFGFIARRRAK